MKDHYLIIGGAGFIGMNLAHHLLSKNKNVTVFDNLSRDGTQHNLQWLQDQHGDRLTFVQGDICDPNSPLPKLVEQVQVVFHLAAQVAVTISVNDPRADFQANALGTFNVLEAIRQSSAKPIMLYSSTNKVYGKMTDLDIVEQDGRYAYSNLPNGIPVSRPLDFYSPYGCSKGTGDQYVIDYARIYGLKTIVFRQSCIYGPHQFGMEDQGWVAWFAIRALKNKPVVIFGDGKQVRDVLYVDDLIAAYNAAIDSINTTSGQAYNVGGGPAHTLSLLETIDILDNLFGSRLKYTFDDWRPGDQLIFVGDISKAKNDFGWEPRIPPQQGVSGLVDWLKQNESLFAHV